MNNKNDIKELSEIVDSLYNAEVRAQMILDAGYGNIKKSVKSIVNPLIDELVELIFDDSRCTCIVKKCFKSDTIQCGDSVCVEENKRLWKNKLNKRIKEFLSAT